MKIIFCDNTLWGLVNFRGEVIKYLKNKGHEVVLVAPEKEDKQMRDQALALIINENYHSRWCALHSNQNGAHISEPNKGHEIFSYDASYFPQRTTRLHFYIYHQAKHIWINCRKTSRMPLYCYDGWVRIYFHK